jgi:hypothetical protein
MHTQRALSIFVVALLAGCGASADARQTVAPSSGVPAAEGPDQSSAATTDHVDAGGSEPRCHGSATPELVTELKERSATLKRCYERELREDPRLGGRMSFQLRIDHDGAVSARVVRDEIQRPLMASCMTHLLTDAPMASRIMGDCLDVIVPFAFVPRKTPVDAGSE